MTVLPVKSDFTRTMASRFPTKCELCGHPMPKHTGTVALHKVPKDNGKAHWMAFHSSCWDSLQSGEPTSQPSTEWKGEPEPTHDDIPAPDGVVPFPLPDDVAVTGEIRNQLRKWARSVGVDATISNVVSTGHLRELWASKDDSAKLERLVDTINNNAYQSHKQAIPANEPAPKPSGAVESAIQALIQATTVKVDAQEVIDQAVQAAIKAVEGKVPTIIHHKIETPTSVVTIEEHTHEVFPQVLRAVGAGLNVYLVGPAGCGKTTLAHQVAKALNIPFYSNGAIASEYKLSGFIDAQGRYQTTPFRQAYQNGGLHLFDEVDGSMPQALLSFNAALANGHADFPDGNLQRHANFRCIAAANTFGRGADRQYVGRNQLDASSLDRFVFIPMDYDLKLERQITGNDEWFNRVIAVRNAVTKLSMRHLVTPRASIFGAALLAAGAPQSQVEESLLWKGLDKDQLAKLQNAL